MIWDSYRIRLVRFPNPLHKNSTFFNKFSTLTTFILPFFPLWGRFFPIFFPRLFRDNQYNIRITNFMRFSIKWNNGYQNNTSFPAYIRRLVDNIKMFVSKISRPKNDVDSGKIRNLTQLIMPSA